jgi:hypothetical protein
VSRISDFLTDIDRGWTAPMPVKIRLPIIGSAALMLQADYERGTKDSDVLETSELVGEVRERLLRLAGQGSDLHRRWRMYLEIVPSALPFLPQSPAWHEVPDLNAELQHFSVAVLDVVDVVVSKLKRFNPNDASDIEAMIDRDLVTHDKLVLRFKSAVESYSMDSRAEDLPEYVANLNRVERDQLGLPPTEIELPPWVG